MITLSQPQNETETIDRIDSHGSSSTAEMLTQPANDGSHQIMIGSVRIVPDVV
jgi:hypothetical protein